MTRMSLFVLDYYVTSCPTFAVVEDSVTEKDEQLVNIVNSVCFSA